MRDGNEMDQKTKMKKDQNVFLHKLCNSNGKG